MTDVINKLIALFLIVVMLLVAPLTLMRKTDRTQNEIRAINAMELFLDTCADAHQIDSFTFNRLADTLESCGMSVEISISTYDIVIADGHTYMWKTREITDLTDTIELELGDIIEIHVEEKTAERTHDIWHAIYKTSAKLFNETLVKMIK